MVCCAPETIRSWCSCFCLLTEVDRSHALLNASLKCTRSVACHFLQYTKTALLTPSFFQGHCLSYEFSSFHWEEAERGVGVEEGNDTLDVFTIILHARTESNGVEPAIVALLWPAANVVRHSQLIKFTFTLWKPFLTYCTLLLFTFWWCIFRLSLSQV